MHPTPDPARYKEEGARLDPHAPLWICHEAKTKVKCHTIIQQRAASATGTVTTFEFYRFRFHFRARDPVHFPRGRAPTWCAAPLERSCATPLPRPPTPVCSSRDPRWAAPPAAWRIGPGLSCCAPSTWMASPSPRGLVLRGCARVRLREPALEHFQAAFAKLGENGVGPGRGRAVAGRRRATRPGGWRRNRDGEPARLPP